MLPVEALQLAENAPYHIPYMQQGAECWRCPLANTKNGPVPPTLPPSGPIRLLVVGEAPGATEVDEGATLIGRSGQEVRNALDAAGFPNEYAALTNAALCRPPNNDMEEMRRQCKKNGWALPIDCCRPRLQKEVARAEYVILMGGASLEGVGIKGKIMRLRGMPTQIPNGPPALPIPHSAFILRESGRVFRGIFYDDVKKAIRLAYNGSTWRDPPYYLLQTAEHLANFLAAQTQLDHLAIDTETNGIDSWTCGLRRIGIGHPGAVGIYSPLSVHGQPMIPAHEVAACTRVFNDFFARTTMTLDFHNFFGFDSVVLGRHNIHVPDHKVRCSLVGHSIGYSSELPHTLDFLGSLFTDVPFWKDDFKHSNVPTDAILDKYLSYDISVTWQVAPYVSQTLDTTGQRHIYQMDAHLSAIGRGMSAIGIGLDRQKQWQFASEYEKKSRRLLKEFHDTCGKDINPRSPKQVADFLYRNLGLPILDQYITDGGEPSTAEPAMLELLAMGVDKRSEKIIKALLGYREADKLLGTFIGRLEERDGMWQLVDGPPVHSDGRVRTTWKTGRATGRWSSGDPINLQNQPDKLRAMYVPQQGNVFVGADFSAIELRLIALRAGDDPLIKAFDEFDRGVGPDLHTVNAATIFKCRMDQVTKEVRTFAKRYVYGTGYGAEPPKIHQTLSLLRDDDLNPVFPGITLAEVERVHAAWWAAHPAILQWRKNVIREWRRNGYLQTRWHHRRRYFLGGENPTEMYNFPIQGDAADIQNDAVMALVQQYPFDFERRLGLVIQGHDQLVVECPASDAERVKQIMAGAMARKIGDMRFPADVKVGLDWKAV